MLVSCILETHAYKNIGFDDFKMSIGVTSKKYFFFHFHTIIIFKDVLKVKACLSHMKFLFNYISPEHNVHFHNRPLSLSL